VCVVFRSASARIRVVPDSLPRVFITTPVVSARRVSIGERVILRGGASVSNRAPISFTWSMPFEREEVANEVFPLSTAMNGLQVCACMSVCVVVVVLSVRGDVTGRCDGDLQHLPNAVLRTENMVAGRTYVFRLTAEAVNADGVLVSAFSGP
jgi:hypothetical protein